MTRGKPCPRPQPPATASPRHLAPAPIRAPYDTTNFFRATDGLDPDSVLAGRGGESVDSARLSTRVTGLLVRLGPDRGPHFGWYRVYRVDGTDSARVTMLTGLGKLPPGEAGSSAVDLDGDGLREPYLATIQSGTNLFTVTVDRLGTGARFPDAFMLNSAWSDLVSPRPRVAGRMSRGRDSVSCPGPVLSVRVGRLFGNDTVRLSLPDSIAPAVESVETVRACPRAGSN